MLKLAYTFFIGILLAVFVGYGIASFYEAPARPQEPNIVWQKEGLSAADEARQRDFNTRMTNYNEKMRHYDQNVALYALLASVVFVSLGLLFDRKINILADGVMLGGVFTLLYSLGRSFASQNDRLSFALAAVALVITGALGYRRFGRVKPG